MTRSIRDPETIGEHDHLAIRDLVRRWSLHQGHTTDTADAFAHHYVGAYVVAGERWGDLPSNPDAWRWAVNGWEPFALSDDGGLHDEHGRCLTDACPDEAH